MKKNHKFNKIITNSLKFQIETKDLLKLSINYRTYFFNKMETFFVKIIFNHKILENELNKLETER